MTEPFLSSRFHGLTADGCELTADARRMSRRPGLGEETIGRGELRAAFHVVSAPAYYHNYMMGQLFACQVHRTISRDVLKDDHPARAFYTDNKDVGEFMRKRVFAPGRSLSWNDLTKHATGEALNPRAFAAEFGGQ